MRKKRRVALGITIITFAFAILFFTVNLKTSAQQQTEQTAEQRFKNIQVLKGMPESQFIPTMQFMAASLGVDCAFCHVRTAGKWEFEKDDKPAKLTARRMIQMTFNINKENAETLGGARVSCYTCHRGATEPLNIPKLPVPLPAASREGGAQKTAAETPPTAAQVVDKYIQAVGGKTAGDRLKTRVMKGTITGSDGAANPFEVHLQSPGKVLAIIGGPQDMFVQGMNGTTGWVKTAKEQRELRPNELARFRTNSQVYEPLQLKEAAANMTVRGREKIGDREAYIVVWNVDDKHSQRFFFDTQTGLLLRVITYTNTALARIPSQTDFEDYRDVDGVKLPFTIRQFSVDSRSDLTRKFTEIKVNVPTDDAQFNPPPAPAQK